MSKHFSIRRLSLMRIYYDIFKKHVLTCILAVYNEIIDFFKKLQNVYCI